MKLNDNYFLNPAHLDLARARYFLKDEDGNPVEEDMDEVFSRVIDHIYQDDKDNAEEALKLRRDKKVIDAGRPLAQAGTKTKNILNCFVIGFGDEKNPDGDTREAISELKRKHFSLQSRGAGTGINFSNLRPNGSICKSTQSRSSGAVGFITDFSYQSANVSQQGNRCLPGETRVAMADGSWREIEDIRAGDTILAYDSKTCGPKPAKVTKFYENGIQDINKYKLFNGCEVSCTDSHRWVTCTDDKDKTFVVRSLSSAPKTGKGIGIAKHVSVFGKVKHKWANILGYMLGDGCFAGETVRVSNMSTHTINRFKELFSKECNTWENKDGISFSSEGELQQFLRDVGLYQCRSYEKFIPEIVFKSDKESIIEVINGLFATDGWVSEDEFGFCSTSKRLMQDLRLLLWKFGIHGNVYADNRKRSNKKHRILWNLCVQHPDSYNACIDNFNVPGKTKYKRKNKSIEQTRGDIYFHKVRKEYPSAYKDLTFCIEIDHPEHLFITECGISHNSGANMGILEDWHPDLYEFVTKKSRSNWENIRRFATVYNEDEFSYFQWAQTYPWQMFNVSVFVSDKFMDMVEKNSKDPWILSWNGKPWHLWEFESVDGPASKKTYVKKITVVAANEDMACHKASVQVPFFNNKKLKLIRGPFDLTAGEWFHMICKNAWEDGCPGVIFEGTTRRFHNGEYFNKIIGSNPCAEALMPKNSACCLTALILPSFFINGKFQWDEFKLAIHQAIRGLDNIISINKTGEKDIDENLLRERRIGLGTTGIAELLIMAQLKYSSIKGRNFVTKILEFLRDESYMASINLAKERGVFPAYEFGGFSQSEFFKTLPEHIQNLIRRHGIRNVTVLTQQPAGTTGTMIGFSTGCEPYFAMSFMRNSRVGSFMDGSPSFMAWLHDNNIDYSEHNYSLCSLREATDVPDYFEEAHEISWKDHLKMQAVFSKYVCSSVSKTTNLPNDSTVEDVKNAYLMAYKLGIKSTTIYRDGSKQQILERITKDSVEKRPKEIIKAHAPKRPNELECDIFHTSVKGDKWTVLVGLLDNRPYEVFCAPQDNFEIAEKYKKGTLVKNGKGSYYLDTGDFKLKNISGYLNNDEHRVITRLLSTCLRHGVTMEFIAEQLTKADGTVVDFSKAIVRVLKKYGNISAQLKNDFKCPSCGSTNVVLNGSCPKCLDCGESKCE